MPFYSVNLCNPMRLTEKYPQTYKIIQFVLARGQKLRMHRTSCACAERTQRSLSLGVWNRKGSFAYSKNAHWPCHKLYWKWFLLVVRAWFNTLIIWMLLWRVGDIPYSAWSKELGIPMFRRIKSNTDSLVREMVNVVRLTFCKQLTIPNEPFVKFISTFCLW